MDVYHDLLPALNGNLLTLSPDVRLPRALIRPVICYPGEVYPPRHEFGVFGR